jgi:hypothetical protein
MELLTLGMVFFPSALIITLLALVHRKGKLENGRENFFREGSQKKSR